ncbi:MAG: hypothetical protein JF595_13155 [Sphingomonadales bacterium]|nr:hypothetical protein [Sphingomonadales bacterium]
MAKRKLKRIAGIKVPKSWRGSAAVLRRIVYDPVISNLIATAIAAGAASAARSDPARELQRKLRQTAQS